MGTATRKIANAFSTSGVISSANINNASLDNITTISGAGDMVLVSSVTASSSASIEFLLGNYKEYKFFFANIHPQTDNVFFTFNLSTDNGSNYNVTKTSSAFHAYHNESDTYAGISYQTGDDLAQSTGEQNLTNEVGADNDQCLSGSLHIFNPSSSTFVKHYLSTVSAYKPDDFGICLRVGGYANTSSILTNIRFKFSSGNIDAGTILMYGKN